jgi:hypothetical protein
VSGASGVLAIVPRPSIKTTTTSALRDRPLLSCLGEERRPTGRSISIEQWEAAPCWTRRRSTRHMASYWTAKSRLGCAAT